MMKAGCYVLVACALVVMVGLVSCKKEKEKNIFYITSNDGLLLRRQPDRKSEALVLMPYATKITVIEKSGTVDDIDGKKGNWYKVTYKGKTGWCFSGYTADFICNASFEIKKVVLANRKKSHEFSVILNSAIKRIITGDDIVVFNGTRDLYFIKGGSPIRKISDYFKIPEGFNWYGPGILDGDRLLISVYTYTDERKEMDQAAPLGGYREGPKDAGILCLDFSSRKAELIRDFEITEDKSGMVRASGGVPASKTYSPSPQSYFHLKGDEFYAGSNASFALLNIKKRTCTLLESDMLAWNRFSIASLDGRIFVALDEGGMDGSGIGSDGCFMRVMNDPFSYPDDLVCVKDRLFASTGYGLVEADYRNMTYVNYVLDDKEKIPVNNSILVDGVAICLLAETGLA